MSRPGLYHRLLSLFWVGLLLLWNFGILGSNLAHELSARESIASRARPALETCEHSGGVVKISRSRV